VASSLLRILLVEDNPGDARLVRESLADSARVELAHCGRLDEALKRLGEQPFDVVILDLSLPDSNGLQTLVRVRTEVPAVPIVVLTGLEDEALGMETVHAGAQDYLVKGEGTSSGYHLARALRYAVERKRLEEDLRYANRTKDEFLAMLSHELRTPLTVIFGRTQMLLEATQEPPALRQGLEAIYGAARMLTHLVDDLLDISRIVSGKLHLARRLVNVDTVLQAALDGVQGTAAAKQIQIRIAADPEAVTWGDPTRLQQVLWNLLANSVKFVEPRGRIDVSVRRADGQVEIRVKDDGRGITPEFLPHVFDRFSQAGRSYSGLGLGLAIVRQLTEMHGGKVTAESPGEGQGATFTVVLPSRAGGST
jgi:signal transduction histidine kinase